MKRFQARQAGFQHNFEKNLIKSVTHVICLAASFSTVVVEFENLVNNPFKTMKTECKLCHSASLP